MELVQRSLAVIRRGTDDIVAFVAQHAYGGFPEPVARELTRHIQETATLCRRCEHCLTCCNPRAVAAIMGEDNGSPSTDLAAEAAQVTAAFEEVANAAYSALSQVRSNMPPRERHPLGDERAELLAWGELFELPTPAAARRSPLRPQPATPARCGSEHAVGQANDLPPCHSDSGPPSGSRAREGCAMEVVRNAVSSAGGQATARTRARAPGEIGRSRPLPTPPPQLRPPSAALSLWHARTPGLAGSAAPLTAQLQAMGHDSPGLGGASSGGGHRTDRNDGAFASLESGAWTRASGSSPTRGCSLCDDGYGDAREGGSGALSRPSPQEVTQSLERLRAVMLRVTAVVSDHVWVGFSPEAEAELARLQLEGRSAARASRRIIQRAGVLRHIFSADEADAWAQREREVESAIRQYGETVEVAMHTMGQRELPIAEPVPDPPFDRNPSPATNSQPELPTDMSAEQHDRSRDGTEGPSQLGVEDGAD